MSLPLSLSLILIFSYRTFNVLFFFFVDNAVNVKVIMRRMEKVGSRVTVAADGLEAVELYKANPDSFDIVS